MLKVVNLTKIYCPKKGTTVRALDGVSLDFPERGLVFLLGKSGSGKSTLLNVAGGLDAPTEGEIIVKGKSSKDFSQSDFDSYRNTYVGFVFQEYNILNEFTVEDNIALALELQGKPKDKEAVASLLAQVDLTGYAKRKPNTLSGGQKQRIAIARALIKSPEIIMADEPTGALDSATGKQVLETLKKLSADKLVIVVSHDREFAEQYGDRIIELKDGKILSDETKTAAKGKALTGNVSVVGDMLHIKKGQALSESDLAEIKAFLQKSEGDVLVAGGKESVREIKKISRINEDGDREIFRKTEAADVPQREYGREDAKFIRSRLPFRHALRMGLSGLKSKPVRLFFTTFLCTVAFVLFGLLSTLTFYDSEATFKETLATGVVSGTELRKEYVGTARWYQSGQLIEEYHRISATRLTDEELASFAEAFGDGVFGAVYADSSIEVQKHSSYYLPSVSAFAYLPEENALRGGLAAYPKNDGEIVLSSYLADAVLACNGAASGATTREQLIGDKITLGREEYTVVGILDSGTVPEKFDTLKENGGDYRLAQEYNEFLADGMHGFVFVTENVLARESGYFYTGSSFDVNRTVTLAMVGADGSLKFPEYFGNLYKKYSEGESGGVLIPTVSGTTAPKEGEAVVGIDTFLEALVYLYESEGVTVDAEHEQTYFEARVALDSVRDTSLTLSERQAEAQRGISLLASIGCLPETVALRFVSPMDGTSFGEEMRFSLVGVLIPEGDVYEAARAVYLSDADDERLWGVQKNTLEYYEEFKTDYGFPEDARYDFVYLPIDAAGSQIAALWSIYESDAFGEDASRFVLDSNAIYRLQTVDETVDTLTKVFLWVGLVMALFAALLLSNFISVSISQKKREIGVLRAVGARGADVFRIFFAESSFITLLCVLLSSVGSLVLCHVINTALAEGLGASVCVFGIPSFAVLLGVALLTVVLATFLPVYSAARKKPVESIRSHG